ncbi:hypothetical protein [Sphingomonas phyllosphaerae]|uniref:hypothetical protein n=1 Tax=Sphingomonas phyllosphaerae TaxID=257003 RepID=UPI0004064EC8|nr:hypothetical protein [Sphingomonas phyllosphaerae]
MIDPTIPSGSPLSGFQYQPPRMAPPAAMSSTFSAPALLPTTPAAPLAQSLPTPPPRKKSTIWDKEHISETLAGIGAGFFAGQNFGDGLGAAAQTIAGRTKQLREEQRPDITYGGPGDRFEIRTDRRTGERTVREVPVFRQAAERDSAAKNRPDFKTTQDMRARALASVAQLPPRDRPAAYRSLFANATAYGLDTTGMPTEWDETYGTLGGMMGLDVNQALNQKRDDAKLEEDMRHKRVTETQGSQRVSQGDARVAQGAARVAQGAQRLRQAPPSARKGINAPKSRAEFDALPSGAKIVAPDGSIRIKP